MIQPATVNDAAAIARIHVHAWRAAYAGIIPADYLASLSEEQRAASWRERLKDGRTITLVAVENDELAGWVSGTMSRDPDAHDEAEVYVINVSPRYWGRGVGRQLMEKIEEALPRTASITLWVLRDNQRAIQFYRKVGYQPDGTEREIELGSASLPEIRFRKMKPNPFHPGGRASPRAQRSL